MPDWSGKALCLDRDPELFFPNGEGRKSEAKIAAAISICSDCPVIRQCLEFALHNNADYGIWGGTTPRQRTRMRRRLEIKRNRRALVVGRPRQARQAEKDPFADTRARERSALQ